VLDSVDPVTLRPPHAIANRSYCPTAVMVAGSEIMSRVTGARRKAMSSTCLSFGPESLVPSSARTTRVGTTADQEFRTMCLHELDVVDLRARRGAGTMPRRERRRVDGQKLGRTPLRLFWCPCTKANAALAFRPKQ
jgi:hypothetical protein